MAQASSSDSAGGFNAKVSPAARCLASYRRIMLM
jgi:hypothetical protein